MAIHRWPICQRVHNMEAWPLEFSYLARLRPLIIIIRWRRRVHAGIICWHFARSSVHFILLLKYYARNQRISRSYKIKCCGSRITRSLWPKLSKIIKFNSTSFYVDVGLPVLRKHVRTMSVWLGCWKHLSCRWKLWLYTRLSHQQHCVNILPVF